jgi:hypothetical protein
MPWVDLKINDTRTIISIFCFKQGGRIGRYALIKSLEKNKKNEDLTRYYICQFTVVNNKPIYTGLNYLIHEKEVPFLVNLYDNDGDHQEHDYELPALELSTKEPMKFYGTFKYAPVSEDCGIKRFILGPPPPLPPSESNVNLLLGLAAGPYESYIENNRRRRKSRKSKSRRRSRKNLSK